CRTLARRCGFAGCRRKPAARSAFQEPGSRRRRPFPLSQCPARPPIVAGMSDPVVPACASPDALYERARAELRRLFGYPDFRGVQPEAIRAVLSGRDVLVLMPTGGGKSLCYQIPALVLPGLTIVVSPLISLMKDQVDALQRRGVPAAFINSTLGPAEVEARLERCARGETKLLYVAPERFGSVDFRRRMDGFN